MCYLCTRFVPAKLVVKWDLDNGVPMKGVASRRVLALIAALEAEGVL